MPELIFQFSTSREFSSRVIREFLGSPFSHVDAVTREGHLYGASNSPDAPCVRGNPNGVAVRPHDYQRFLRRFRARIPVSEAQEHLFWELAEQELGKAFDSDAVSFKYQITDQPFTRDWRLDEHWFCPELHGYLLEQIGLWDYPLMLPVNRLSPHSLLQWMWPKMSNKETFWLFPPELTPIDGEETTLRNLDAGKIKQLFSAPRLLP